MEDNSTSEPEEYEKFELENYLEPIIWIPGGRSTGSEREIANRDQ